MASSTSPASSAAVVAPPVTVGATRWLRLETMEYVGPGGVVRKWDRAVRTTKQGEGGIDAVCILAILRLNDGREEVVLVRQYRPPMHCDTIELPAGLIDAGESPQDAAVRELLEETGLSGVCVRTSPAPLCMSPGLTNETVALVTVKVDMTLPVNQNPRQRLEETEEISVLRVDKRHLLDELHRLSTDEGCSVFTGLWMFAEALALAS